MKYIDYVKYLKSKNINLFDFDYRISYNNFIHVLNNKAKPYMIGGGNVLNQYDDIMLRNIIDISLSPMRSNLYLLL
jgi:hypothetical protein